MEGLFRILNIGEFIPDSEKIFHTEKFKNRLEEFDKWMDTHKPDESDIEELCSSNNI
ncbi:hypothetical protein QUF70_12415 [Desulfobacterales bacterium HSG17]|nr:hypothetical protein [Desulfobacterales bacterium HSG17]